MNITEKEVTLRVLTPSEGHILTDGKGTYSDKVYLGQLDDAENWTEVTTAEYEAWKAEQESKAEQALPSDN